MKVKVSNLLVTLIAVLLLTLTAYGQDELPLMESQDPTHVHRNLNMDEDRILIYDQPGSTSILRDSVQQIQRAVPSHPIKTLKPDVHRNGHKEKDEEDALSFNFLYYMIQKFKMSDLIDN